MLGISGDWIAGYFAAARQFAPLVQPPEGPGITDWLAALGTVGACTAAFLSWLATRQTAAISLEIERGRLIEQAVEAHHDAIERGQKVVAVRQEAGPAVFGKDNSPEMRALLDELDGDFNSFQHVSTRVGEVWKEALAAKDMKSLADARKRLSSLRSDIRMVQLFTDNRQMNAKKNGLIHD